MSDAFLRTFRKQLSLYGSGKVNILTAPPIVLAALVRACARDSGDAKLLDQKYIDEILQEWDKVKNGGLASNDPKGFAKFISTQVRDVDIKSCEGLMGTESENFTIESTGSVGGVKRKLTLILRVHDTEEESYYFRNN